MHIFELLSICLSAGTLYPFMSVLWSPECHLGVSDGHLMADPSLRSWIIGAGSLSVVDHWLPTDQLNDHSGSLEAMFSKCPEGCKKLHFRHLTTLQCERLIYL